MNHTGYEDRVSTVCIDATEVKRIREDAQLTQLYVSKVVGVTTDTISRWENNRYPTIRRENALKLAEALEVQLDDILLKPVAEEPASVITTRKNSPFVWLFFAILLLIAIFVIGSLVSQSPSSSRGGHSRETFAGLCCAWQYYPCTDPLDASCPKWWCDPARVFPGRLENHSGQPASFEPG